MSQKLALIVDDSNTDRLLLKRALERIGYRTEEAMNGEQAIELAASRRPDLIMMDVVMPKMSGFEATREIKDADETKHIPVIICSTKSLATDQDWARKQGADGYILKPISEESLIAALGGLKKPVTA